MVGYRPELVKLATLKPFTNDLTRLIDPIVAKLDPKYYQTIIIKG